MGGSLQDAMAKKLQAAARGYITRKVGGGKKSGKQGKKGKHAKKSENMQALIIQTAFKKYKAYKKKH